MVEALFFFPLFAQRFHISFCLTSNFLMFDFAKLPQKVINRIESVNKPNCNKLGPTYMLGRYLLNLYKVPMVGDDFIYSTC